MFYAVYLIVMAVILLFGAVTRVSLFPALSISINFQNIINFLDYLGGIVLLAVILAALILTRSIRPMKDAFVFMFRKDREYSTLQLEDCLLAVKTALLSAFAGGFAMFLIAVINLLKNMNLEGGVSTVGVDLSLGLLSLLYAMLVAFILLPIYVALKRTLTHRRETESGRQVVVRTRHKKAG